MTMTTQIKDICAFIPGQMEELKQANTVVAEKCLRVSKDMHIYTRIEDGLKKSGKDKDAEEIKDYIKGQAEEVEKAIRLLSEQYEKICSLTELLLYTADNSRSLDGDTEAAISVEAIKGIYKVFLALGREYFPQLGDRPFAKEYGYLPASQD